VFAAKAKCTVEKAGSRAQQQTQQQSRQDGTGMREWQTNSETKDRTIGLERTTHNKQEAQRATSSRKKTEHEIRRLNAKIVNVKLLPCSYDLNATNDVDDNAAFPFQVRRNSTEERRRHHLI
jgi:hypothetical protein